MTDKEKFRKEVEKLKSNLIYGACSSQIAMETRCKEEAYNEVLSILNTMQEEPVSRTPVDIEVAMQEVEEKSRAFTEAHKGEDADTILAQIRGEEPVSEDLESAALMHFKDVMEYEIKTGLKMANITSFKAGAKWKVAKLMENAIDVTVHIEAGCYPYIPQMELYDYDKDVPLAKAGDRYKVILIKEG